MENFNGKLYLQEMYSDDSYPNFLVDKMQSLLITF